MTEFGVEAKTRFKVSDQFLLKPAVGFAYRTYGGNAGSGFAIDVSAAIQYRGEKVRPYLELGILTQPAGGNTATDITFSPIFQTSIGITF